jgi:hypothetical protein
MFPCGRVTYVQTFIALKGDAYDKYIYFIRRGVIGKM